MLPLEIELVALAGDDDLHWPFHGDGTPYFDIAGHREHVDPFPAYAHDKSRVRDALRDLTRVWPAGGELVVAITDRETTGRTNAWASRAYGRRAGAICLSGKRIPPHPAVTRYIVAHEYGHQVQFWLEEAQGLDEDDVLEQYIELRRPTSRRYGGGRWHENVGEVFACDFRVVVAGVEPEYWPHPGVFPPGHNPGVAEWWSFAQRSWVDHIADKRLAARQAAQEQEAA